MQASVHREAWTTCCHCQTLHGELTPRMSTHMDTVELLGHPGH